MAKQSWAAKLLADFYTQSSKNHPLDSDQYQSRSLLSAVDSLIVDRTLKGFGDWFDKNEFSESSYSENPSYYATTREFRGNKIQSADDLCDEAYILYHEAWNMTEYWLEVHQKRFVEILPDYAEEFGIKILCPHTTDKYTNVLTIPESEIYWGNTAILTEEDWDKCSEKIDYDGVESYTDLVVNDVSYYVVESIINVFEEIDEELEWWNGSNGVLESVESMLNDENFRLQALMAVKEITDAVNQKTSGWDRRVKKIQNIVSKYELLHEDFVA